jgi:hypothetical protein
MIAFQSVDIGEHAPSAPSSDDRHRKLQTEMLRRGLRCSEALARDLAWLIFGDTQE